MTTDRTNIDAVLDKEGEILERGVAMALAEYSKNPTAESVRNLEASKKAFAAFKKKQEEDSGQRIIRLTADDALLYLKEQGYKCGKTKLNEDKAIIGYATNGTNNTFTHADLDRYARKFLRPLSETDDNHNIERKLKADADVSEQKARRLKHENEVRVGQYVLRSEMYRMLAVRAKFLMDNTGADFIHSNAAKIIEIVGGNPDTTPELVAFWLRQHAEVFDYYAKPMRFEVPASALAEFMDEEEAA